MEIHEKSVFFQSSVAARVAAQLQELSVKQLREATELKVQGEPSRGAAEDFKLYARRLVKDLELKGTVRTAVEGMNLSLHWSDESDVLAAECIRTFPTVTFPATMLLKREEAETPLQEKKIALDQQETALKQKEIKLQLQQLLHLEQQI